MKAIKITFIFLISIILNSCTKEPPTNMMGLWISNEETSMHWLSGTRKIVVYFDNNKSGEIGARGIILWNDDYSSEWEISDFKYDEVKQTIEFTDDDGDTFKGILDKKNKRIVISIYFKDTEGDTPSDSLILIPADKNLENKLLYPRIPINNGVTYEYKTPEQLNDGLQTTSIYTENVDADSILHLINRIINQEFGRLESLLILKDNKLIVEEYFYGYDQNKLHKINSCSKSVTALLLGISLDQHKSVAVNQPIFSFFPQYDSLKTKDKEQITLQHVLTMTPGFEWHEHPKELYEIDERIPYILSLPLEAKPGEKFNYNSGLPILLGGIITQLENEDVEAFADESFFKPLGIKDYKWRRHKNGKIELWYGLQLKPRDMAKIGLLVLNNGKWKDKQIVSEEWISESTKPRVPESEYFDYGYQWWLRTKNTKQWWKKAESTDKHDMIVALGSGGQYIIVVKDLNLVVITTSSNYNNDKDFSVFPMVIEDIIPNIKG